MPLSLSCPCGARFEVEETFAGRQVACPECQQPLKAPFPQRVPRRTSGLALASMILAVAGAFTLIGTVVAVVLGVAALVSLRRHRETLAGAGYAVFGIVWGVVFTGLTLFAYSSGEVFNLDGWLRDAQLAGQVDYGGPLEVVRRAEGFAITRPSEKWGLIGESPDPIIWPDDPNRGVDLTLINIPRNALVDITFDEAGNQTLEQCQERVLGWFGDRPPAREALHENPLLRFTHCKVRQSRRLQPQGATEMAELLLDVRYAGEGRTYLVRLVKRGDDLYILRGWAPKRRFAQAEPEIRQALDSFRLLDH
ncbi:MAG TPA: DUF4190 domain-containing protein [Gemmataceae bacterium]|jgi:hypothetical protein|nr:DUF4190 domain-containing protein [Gemmataceae bacterium]